MTPGSIRKPRSFDHFVDNEQTRNDDYTDYKQSQQSDLHDPAAFIRIAAFT